jgi:hypothetical protein
LIAVGSQVSLLSPDAVLTPLLDTGVALGRAAQVAADGLGNLYVYPGYGSQVYAYAAGGGLRWTDPTCLRCQLRRRYWQLAMAACFTS